MFSTLPRGPVIIIRNQIIQQPDFRHHKPRVALDGAQPPRCTPSADRMAVVAGDVADLPDRQHIGRFGQLFGQAAAQFLAAGAGQVQAAEQGVLRRFVVGVVLVPAAGRRVAGRVGVRTRSERAR